MKGGLPARVLMTTDTLGGVWTYSVELASALQRHGIAVVLATMGGPLSPDQRGSAAAITNLVLEESRFRLEWMPDATDEVAKAGAWLLELERRWHPDLIHLCSYAHGVLPWMAPVLLVAHSCVRSWFLEVKGHPAPVEWDAYTAAATAGLRAADMVVGNSATFLDAVDRLYGPLPRKRVVLNGRNAARFRPADKEPFVFSAGRLWDEAKNLAALDAVAASLDWPVLVAGETGHPAGARVEAPRVRLLGALRVSEMADHLGRATIFALPARYEPFGLAVLEAALSGCALVLGDIASLRELWDGAALFCPPDDHPSLAQTLRSLIRDPAEARRMGDAARRRGLTYSDSRMAQGYCSLYRELLTGRRAAARTATAASGGRA